MAKKRVRSKVNKVSSKRTFTLEKNKPALKSKVPTSSKIKSLTFILLVFAALSLILFVLYNVTTHQGLQDLFFLYSVIFFCISVALLMVVLIYVLLKYNRN